MTTTIEPTSRAFPLVKKLQDRYELPPPARRKEIREAAGATIQEVAQELGVTYQAVWQWENRPPRRLRPDLAIAYHRLLGQLQELVAARSSQHSPQK